MTNFGLGWRPSRLENSSLQLAGRMLELRSALQLCDPGLVAARSGVSYLTFGPGQGEFHFPFFGKVITVTWPSLTGHGDTDEELPPIVQALLLYYLVTADGTVLTGKWVSFADLPDGRMYNAAYQGYSGDKIVKAFGFDLPAFSSACLKAGGKPVEVGSASFVMQALPNLPMLVTYWLGDEDFPSSCKILFDASATHYLPIDGCAIAGSMLTNKLCNLKSQGFGEDRNNSIPTFPDVGIRTSGEL
ncbi:MAG: DUF3786 domain-containing protein [Anaerolineales bacterium]|nr:DUF3786 domain-containing protein [Anaerolineales bacterium]MDP2778114.1 DUF3786 domain-containing protein [Anaerolineales bacterium]